MSRTLKPSPESRNKLHVKYFPSMIKKFLFVLLWFISVGLHANGQRASYKDSIEVVGNYFTGLKFYQHDQKISLRLLSAVMHGNEEALKYLNRAKTNNTVGVITGFIGGLLVGY